MYICDLHLHARSLCDADINAKALAKRIKEFGGKGCAITDHGAVTAIEDFRSVFDENELKLIPGCEVYVDNEFNRQHLVLLGKNYQGWLGIAKIVTEANKNLDKGFPVIKEQRLFEIAEGYKGDIIALSACISGVISSIFLRNFYIDKKIEKLQKKQKNYTEAKKLLTTLKTEQEETEKELYKAVVERDDCKKNCEIKTTAIEKQLSKGANIELENEYKRLIDIRNKAIGELPKLKERVDCLKRDLTSKKAEVKDATADVEAWNKLEAEIQELAKSKKSETELCEEAKQKALQYRSIFGEDFYIELQYHGIAEEAICYPQNAKLARELNIPVVATNDVHILENTSDERLKRQILRSLRFGEKFEDESDGDSELYIKTQEELTEWLNKILPSDIVDEAISNIGVIFDKCNVVFPKDQKHYPKFSKTENANKLLVKAIREGGERRFPEGMTQEYKDRVNYEYGIIKQMGYSDYHLIVKDFLQYGKLLGYVPEDKVSEAPLTITELEEYIKKNGWTVSGFYTGLGRGSAAGSLICYLLGITNVDPIKYGLLFERFLNPERISMPDIDSDLAATIRPKVIEYVKNKYGNDAVCGIMTVTKQAPKGSINMAAKFYGFKVGKNFLELGRKITSFISKEPNVSFATLVDVNGNPVKTEGKTLYSYLYDLFTDKDSREILRWAKILEGSVTAYGAHAAGIVISDNEDVSDYIPLRANTKLNIMTTQCDMVQTEAQGLLKMDFLGLKTLDIITETIRMIEKNTGSVIDVLKDVSLDDRNVYKEIFTKGNTNSVFQFESAGMKNMLQRFKPETFEDLIILVSTFRPGPIQFLDDIINVKNGVKKATYKCPELEPILGKTYGAIVYQEQVMEIFQKLAGYSFGGADQVRRYMSKKKAEKLAHEREAFINGDPERKIKGCAANGINPAIADELFDQMMAFAEYAFNKSHACCYAYTAYITAWLKFYYPAEFIAAALNWAELDEYKGLVGEAASMSVKVKAPDINFSEKKFAATDNETIYFGLSSIRGVKDNADDIFKEREKGSFMSLINFIGRCNPRSTVVTNLIDAGAFDEFCSNRESMHKYVAEISPIIKKAKEKKEKLLAETDATKKEKLEKSVKELKTGLKSIRYLSVSENQDEKLKKEYDLLGAYITDHPLNHYPEIKNSCPINLVVDGATKIYGVISNFEEKKRKKDGAIFATFDIEDKTDKVSAVMFVNNYSRYKQVLRNGLVAVFDGECKSEGDEDNLKKQFVCSELETVLPKAKDFLLEIPDYEKFKTEYEKTLMERCKKDGGQVLLYFDRTTKKVIKAAFTVGKNILSFGAKEV